MHQIFKYNHTVKISVVIFIWNYVLLLFYNKILKTCKQILPNYFHPFLRSGIVICSGFRIIVFCLIKDQNKSWEKKNMILEVSGRTLIKVCFLVISTARLSLFNPHLSWVNLVITFVYFIPDIPTCYFYFQSFQSVGR